MDLDFSKIKVREIVGVDAQRMEPRFIPWREKPRYSDCFIYIRSGNAHYHFSNDEFDVNAGDILYLAYKSQYDILVRPGYSVVYIDCMLETPKNINYKSARFALADAGRIEYEMLRLEKSKFSPNHILKLKAMAVLYTIFSEIEQMNNLSYQSRENRLRMESARAVIEQHYTESEFTCEGLGVKLGLSEIHFRRVFREKYGISPSRYLSVLRMHTAKQMLIMNSKMSIAAIAEQCGYHSVYYFSRAFKRETGVTPSEYRSMPF